MSIPYEDGPDLNEWDYLDLTPMEWACLFLSRTVYLNEDNEYACTCRRYREEKRCHHLHKLRPQAEVKPDPRYL